MIKKISILTILLACTLNLMAQGEKLSSKDMIAITPMVSCALNLPDDAKASLGTKLGQMVTQSGFGSNSCQFVLTANVIVLDKQATATAPVQFMVNLEVSVYLLNVAEGVVIDETSFNVKGVDRLENKAVIQAINQIQPRSPKVSAWMNSCKEKIVAYYNTRIPTMMIKAKALADQNEYERAIEMLSGIPESVDQYQQVADMISAVYQKMIDRDAKAAILQAKGLITLKKYGEAFDALLAVDPTSSHSKEAFAMIEQVRQSIAASENAAYAARNKQYEEQKESAQRLHDDRVMLTKMQIQAAQKVGVEAAKSSSPSVASAVTKWFLGKFK